MIVCDLRCRWAEGSCFRHEMVGAAYVGGCTVTFMALQVSRDVVDDHDTFDGPSTFSASSDPA